MRKIILIVLLLLGIAHMQADVTTKTTGNTTTVTSTDTTGVVDIPDWTQNITQPTSGWYEETKTLSATVQVRRGSILTFDWSVTVNNNYGWLIIYVDGKEVISTSNDTDSGSYENIFVKAGKHTIKAEFSYYCYGGGSLQASLTNFRIDHDANQSEENIIPFRTTTITDGKFADDTKWYKLRMGSSNYYLHASDSIILASEKAEVDSSYYWAFTKEADNRIALYNLQTGALRPLTIPNHTQKAVATLGGNGCDSSYLLDSNSDGFTLYLADDTCSFYLISNQMKVYHPTTIYRTYNTSATTRMYADYVGTPPFVPITDLWVSAVADTILQTETTTVYWQAYPYGTTDTGFKVTISDPDVLKVTQNYESGATVQGVNPGTATITVTSTANPAVHSSCTITVLRNVKVESITLELDTLRMKQGEMHPVKVTVLPDDAIDPTYKWTNTKPTVATITNDGLVYALSAGTTVLTAKANDGSNKSGKMVVIVTAPAAGDILAHSDQYLYAVHTDSSLTAIPISYIESKTYVDKSLSLHLTGGAQYVMSDVEILTDVCPFELPQFSSYKFNDKFNDQLFSAAKAEESDLAKDTITIPVAAIGKSLTASFQLPDSLLRVWIGSTQQYSKYTRQRFDKPLTYTIGYPEWHELALEMQSDSTTKVVMQPFGRHTTISVDWLTNHSTSEYNVPRIDITLDGATQWNQQTYINNKVTYRNATIKMDGVGIWDSMEETPILIKGRGNSSWSANVNAKNPYHFKFDNKQKPFGMKAGKHWLLIANKMEGSQMTNAIAQRASQMLGVAYANHVIPVELYINGSYRGSYNLTERIGLGNNSIDLDNDSLAAVLELDTYTDEKIINTPYYDYYLPVKLKDGYAENDTVHQDAYNDFCHLTDAVSYGRNFDGLIDTEKSAAFLTACELIANTELKHPKSVFLFSENIYDGDGVNDPTPWVLGPVWDCDWAFGYQASSNYFISNADMDFFTEMGRSDSYGTNPQEWWYALRHGSQAIDKARYSLLFHFMTQGGLTELQEYVQDYYDFVAPSLTHNKQNATSSRDGSFNYKSQVTTAQTWLAKRTAAMFSQAESYDLSDDPDAPFHPTDDIRTLRHNTAVQHVIFDLSGRRITGKPATGIYIIDGKKVFVK